MAIAPTFRKSQKLTSRFSLRKAINQRMVASDPVIERFGPRSTPMRTASAIGHFACSCVKSAANDEAKWKIVYQVVGDSDRESSDQTSAHQAEMLHPVEPFFGVAHRTNTFDGIDHYE